MAIQLGSAYGKIIIDSSGVTIGVGTATKSLGTLATVAASVGAVLKQAGQAMTIGLTLPILAVGWASIQAASSYEETKNRSLVVFKEMSDGVIENSNRAALTLGMSKKQYLDYASNIGAALTAGGMSIKESTVLAEQAVKHFADIGSFYEASVEDVALAWQSAIRGQYEPIQKYFPFISDAYLKTYGVANGMLDANTKTLTANQRAVILNAIALNEKLNPALNDFAETSGSLANQGKSLKAQFGDALIALGTNLLPIALKVVNVLNRLLEAFNNAPPFVQKAVLAFLLFLAVLGPILSVVGSVIGAISGLVTMASGLGITMATVTSVATAAGAALLSVGTVVLSILGPLLLIIATLALVYWAFKNNIGGITTTVTQLWFIIKYYFGLMKDWMVNAFMKVNWGTIGKYIIFGIANGLLLGIPGLVLAAANAAKSVLSTFDKELDMHSPSKAMFKRGVWSGQGFTGGLQQSVKPDAVAKMLARPTSGGNSSSQQNINMNFANGLTIRQVQEMIANNNEKLLSDLSSAFGGA